MSLADPEIAARRPRRLEIDRQELQVAEEALREVLDRVEAALGSADAADARAQLDAARDRAGLAHRAVLVVLDDTRGEGNREHLRALYAARVMAGECVKGCGEPAMPGAVRCEKHHAVLAVLRQREKERP